MIVVRNEHIRSDQAATANRDGSGDFDLGATSDEGVLADMELTAGAAHVEPDVLLENTARAHPDSPGVLEFGVSTYEAFRLQVRPEQVISMRAQARGRHSPPLLEAIETCVDANTSLAASRCHCLAHLGPRDRRCS